ncbi:hypothetical protein GCM10027341_45200 [Spirosoma knui]
MCGYEYHPDCCWLPDYRDGALVDGTGRKPDCGCADANYDVYGGLRDQYHGRNRHGRNKYNPGNGYGYDRGEPGHYCITH